MRISLLTTKVQLLQNPSLLRSSTLAAGTRQVGEQGRLKTHESNEPRSAETPDAFTHV